MEMPRGAKPAPRYQLAASVPYRPEAQPKPFLPTGRLPSPNAELADATPYQERSAPPSFLNLPSRKVHWHTDTTEDSFWVEEAFAKACAEPQILITNGKLLETAKKCGTNNFSYFMQTHGFEVEDRAYLDGQFLAVNWADPVILQSAIAKLGPVKVGIKAKNLLTHQHGLVMPGVNGWALYAYPPGLTKDHWASLCGFGLLRDLVTLFEQKGIKVNVPTGMPNGICYALFIWNSIGIIDEQSLLNMTNEAWVRNPVTLVK